MWKQIEAIMKLRKLNQNQLATLANVRASTITDLKTGRTKNPSFDYMCKLADALKVSLDDFR